MTTSRSISIASGALLASTAAGAGRTFRGRRGLVVLAVAALGLGAVLNWSSLVAAGIAPVLLSVLPCAVMCALGLCMNKLFANSTASAAIDQPVDLAAPPAPLPAAETSCCGAEPVIDRSSADTAKA